MSNARTAPPWALREFAATALVWTAAAVVAVIFLAIIGTILYHGISGLSWGFLLEAPESAGREGGIASILIATLLILFVCLAVAVPIGVGTAVLLSEFTSNDDLFGRLIRRSLDVLAAVPSIVFGLFGNVFFCRILGLGFSLLSGGLTLACMVLPILIRSAEEGLRSVPREYGRSSAALAISRTSTLIHLLIPAAVPGIIVGLVLGIGRALAETAALIYTSGYVDRMPSSLLDSGRSLSIHIYDLSMNVPGGDANAYRSAFILLLLLLILNWLAASLADRWLKSRIVP